MAGRVLKDPAVRKQEILDTAMILFRDKGYDATSIADIAKAMNVVPGLCYRYFPGKKEIFDEAVKQYAVESCRDFLEVIHDHNSSLEERLEKLATLMIHKEDNSRHHDFYHTPGNETFHFQLGLEMLKYMTPYISRELERLNKKGQVNVEDPQLVTEFLLYGQIPLWLSPTADPHSREFLIKMERVKMYTLKLLGVEK